MSGPPAAGGGPTTCPIPIDAVQYCLIASVSAVAFMYTIELTAMTLATFKRYTGLYFWSLMIGSWGATVHAIGLLLQFLTKSNWLVGVIPSGFGWLAMVTGSSFTLYSRLHLVTRNQTILRGVLALLIFNTVAIGFVDLIFVLGSKSPATAFWTPKYNTFERIQLVGWSLTEFLLSAIYVWATVGLLRTVHHSRARTVMFELIGMSALFVAMDVVLLGLQFSSQYIYVRSLKSMFYIFKFRLEFVVLNRLFSITKHGLTEGHRYAGAGAGGVNGNGLSGAPSNDAAVSLEDKHRPAHMVANPSLDSTWTIRSDPHRPLSPHDTHGIYRTRQIEVVCESIEPPLLQQQRQQQCMDV